MTKKDVADEIKLELTGQILELEIDDSTIDLIISKGLRELQRFWDESSMISVPYASCIDYSGTPLEDSSSIVKVYRTQGLGVAGGTTDISVNSDPLYMQQWMIFSNGGTMYNLNDYVMNYAAWSTLSQIKNTISTDMAFREDKHNHKLYINCAMGAPSGITIEYIPKLQKVEDIKSDYWIDILIKLCLALTKITLGRIRTRFTQSNTLWAQDGETMLSEGTTELKELRDMLTSNSNLIYPID